MVVRCIVLMALSWCLVALAPVLTAQDIPSPDLRQMRQQVRHDLLTALLPEKKRHLATLQEVEKKLAADSDYAGAIKARDESRALEREIAAIQRELAAAPFLSAAQGNKATKPIELSFALAQTSHASLDTTINALTNWSGDQATATWKSLNLAPGGYEVRIRYTSDAAVTMEAQEAFYKLQALLPATTGKSEELALGTLRISSSDSSLTLATLKDSPPSNAGNLKIYSVILFPSAS